MIFESKEQELMFMNLLWLRLFYLQEHLKETGNLNLCKWSESVNGDVLTKSSV